MVKKIILEPLPAQKKDLILQVIYGLINKYADRGKPI